ncbi:hypothetical protein COEREDRAFT_79437 [Coemansia reversa NRRL 1564]|uniref:mRNA decay factor PAT1 domain-containing protein n=1 Tax=Coemansia reversa (strain ATCC 12441 / NRRL 1564) TaxID=763665 RepID=A0A2G5BIS1_COERN|nr:hypothetical protein COEREDRAFT_79437 [Coemansia reversa NRRL 1564]|eukprot:PIA18905.1 hypothetical protein COEREDRAFT_79437 [Coemansia reversa NRRL 1564]
MSGSFFGGTNAPEDDPIARGRAEYLASTVTDLDNRLESLALEDNLGEQLPEDQDTFNTETFDADVGEITNREFDFFQSTLTNQAKLASPQQHQNQPPPQDTMQMLQSMGVSINHSVGPEAGAGSEGVDEHRRITTLAELEAKIISQRSTPMSGVAQTVHRMADPETIARRREQRLEREAALTRYNNMMSQRDKEYIVRIQISQLLTDDPAADDFYCHMYQLSRGAIFGAMQQQQQQQQQVGLTSRSGEMTEAGRSPSVSNDSRRGTLAGVELQNSTGQERRAGKVGSPVSKQQTGGERLQQQQHLARARRSNTQSSMARMQQQVQRIVNEARRRPKVAHVAAEGALGKISVTSARNPKQAIQVQRSHGGSVSQGSPGPLTEAGGALVGLGDARNPTAERRKTLRAIEEVYTGVLQLEQLVREQARLPNVADHPSVQGWVAAYGAAKERAWAELEATQPILNVYPHPLVRVLAFAKGKRAVGRLVHHLSMDQVLALTTTIIANFESLDVCRVGSFGYTGAAEAQQREETDLFLHLVMPTALGFLAEASLQIVNGLFALFMERNNVAWVVRTRPALVFLMVVLGRTAALKQQQPQPQQSQEVYQAAELYNHLFNSLRGSLAAIFPQRPLGHMPSPTEDMHAWQFLAALAASASAEQQHALVAEAREKVLEKVQLAKDPRVPAEVSAAILVNVNMFLNALGLDASQVTT